MDKLYVGDIPQEYCYAVFSDNHIDLFKTLTLTGIQDYYRIYLYQNSFQYEHLQTNYSDIATIVPTFVDVTDDWLYRRDMPSILFMGVVYCCILVILFNIVSSVFKKGGLLGGLL